MNIVVILESLAVAVVLWFFISQVLVPVMRERPLFPMFSRKSELQEALAQVKQQEDEAALQKEIAERKANLTSGEKENESNQH